ncbi:hypothetical protein HZY97_19060 [Sphingomonas sp. R-74633]|uniref:hypothetical protein n=1 Tax=Sphingomonas sp. R-74633 TaxID=2751188 RepID=UPI0015D20BD2|nr:hypothetical protein [Sphingomonas sp. R-74633]NYT42881.1 hypothetical protein [Sphingomonas sp. R-74633]
MLALLLVLSLTDPGFSCAATGTKLLVPATTPDAACTRLRAGLARAGVRPDGVRVALRFEKPGIASARVIRVAGGRATELPEISVATSDKAMGPSTIDLLAREIAGRLAKR